MEVFKFANSISLLPTINILDDANDDGGPTFRWIDISAHRSLEARKNRRRLKPHEKIYLAKILAGYPDAHSLIKEKFHLFCTTLYRLKWMTKNNFEKYQELETRSAKESLLEQAIHSVLAAIVEPTQFPLTIERIKDELRARTRIDLPNCKVIKYLKEKLRFSFKKGSYRPPSVRYTNHKLARGWFSVQLLRLLLKGQLILNWDECSFNRSTRKNYSWLPMGSGGSIINSTVVNRCSLILSILLDGSWIGIIKAGTVSSEVFSIHLFVLARLVDKPGNGMKKPLYIMLDNAKHHHSELSQRSMQTLGLKTVYLTAYSPEFTPVEEWFKAIKSILKSHFMTRKIDYTK